MNRVAILGNSGSGKSTLAKAYSNKYNLAILDLDVLAWTNEISPNRKPLSESIVEIQTFMIKNPNWVIEGCYADLLGMITPKVEKLIFLNPGIDICMENCENRPWEPHKYKTLEDQNKNLEMLLNWVKQYPERDDEFSLKAHQKLFDDFVGEKMEFNHNLNLTEDIWFFK